MAYGYISQLDKTVERKHVRFNNRYGIAIAGDKAHSKSFSEEAYEKALEPKELYIVKDAEHIDLYDKVDKIPFTKIEKFFKEHLK